MDRALGTDTDQVSTDMNYKNRNRFGPANLSDQNLFKVIFDYSKYINFLISQDIHFKVKLKS